LKGKFGFQNWRLKRREEKEDRFLGEVEKGSECLGRREMYMMEDVKKVMGKKTWRGKSNNSASFC
jgi:hypothetical protein